MIFDVFENLLWRQGVVAPKADWSRNGSKGERAFLHYQLKHIFRKAVLFCLLGVCGTGCAVTQSETFMKENDLNLDETRLHPSPLPP